jgi:hypothetical protein
LSRSIEFSLVLNDEDYAAWSVYIRKLGRAQKPRKFSTLRWVCLAIYVVAVFLWPAFQFWRDAANGAVFLETYKSFLEILIRDFGLLLLASLAIILYVPKGMVFAAMDRRLIYSSFRAYVDSLGQELTMPVDYRLNEEGVAVGTPHVRLVLDWPAFTHVGETPEHFFAAFKWANAVVIPKRGLSEEQAAAVRAMFHSKIGGG